MPPLGPNTSALSRNRGPIKKAQHFLWERRRCGEILSEAKRLTGEQSLRRRRDQEVVGSSPVTSTKKTAEILLCGFFVATKRCSCRHLILPYALFAVKIFWGLPNTVPLPKSRKARPESIRFRGAPSVPNILRDGPVSRVLSSAVIYLGVSSPIRSSGVHGGIRAGNPYEYRPTLHRTGFTWHGALPSRR